MSDSNQSSIPTISEEVHKDEEATSVEAPPATSAAGDSTSQDKSTTATIIATTTPAIPSRMLSAPPRMTQERQTLSGHALHDKLRTYESQRRLAHASKFETSTLHWKSYRDLLAASVQETARAQRIVMGTSRAHQLYSEALTAMYEDVFLDEKGNTMLKEKQQRKFYQVRKPSTRRIVSRTSLTGSSSDGSAVFASIRQAQHVFAERFGENAKNMDVEIGEEVGRLVEELKAQCSGMEKLGDAILAELEKTEQEVAAAWSSYLNVSMEEYGTNSGIPPSNLATPQESSQTLVSSDLWIVEMQYRVAVAYQNRAWEMGSAELARLFQTVKHEECRRRMNLRELLVAFVQRQQRLFLSLPPIHNPILEELAEMQTNRDDIEKELEAAIRDRTLGLRRGMGTMSKDPSLRQGIGQATEEEGDFTLESPLNSELLRKAKVVEIRSTGATWKICLATITADSYLHMFDLPADRIKLGATPEAAFYALAPNVIIPSAESLSDGKSNFSRGWADSISPSESVVLAKSIIIPNGDNSFVITESVATTGASKMFAKSVSRKLMLRTESKEETDDWITILKTPPY